jgi:hypothetical protein
MTFIKNVSALIFLLSLVSCIRFTLTGRKFEPLPKDVPVDVVLRLTNDDKFEKIGILENTCISLGYCINDAQKHAREYGGDTIILVGQILDEKHFLHATWEIARKNPPNLKVQDK